MSKYLAAVSIGLIVLFGSWVSTASAAGGDGASEFSLGVGYAHISIGNSQLDSENALRFDPAWTFSPVPKLPQLRLGAAFGFSLVLDNSERTIISNDGGLVIVGHSDLPLVLYEPEVRISWRQYVGDLHSVFIEPGIAAGGVFANLKLDGDDSGSGKSFNDWESSFSARAFINLGFEVPDGVAGFQASYMHGGTLDFAENARGDVEEFYIGVFGSLRF